MIPTIRMRVPVPRETEYASSPIAIEPSYRRDILMIETDVSLEYAAFLIDIGELDFEDYIELVHEEISDRRPSIEDGHEEYIAFLIVDRAIRNYVIDAVKRNTTSWEDWV